MILDPSSDIGKIRLRVGDYQDLPYFPDEVYQTAINDSNGNLPKASILMARYILALLSQQTRQKLVQIEIHGDQLFSQYLTFVKATIMNPYFMDMQPLPYTPLQYDCNGNVVEVPLIQFTKDWNNNWRGPTSSQVLHATAYPKCVYGYMSYPSVPDTTCF